MKRIRFTEEQEEYLRLNFRTTKTSVLALKLGVKRRTILDGLKYRNLIRTEEEILALNKGVKLTEEQEEYLRQNFRTTKNSELGEKLGIKYSTVQKVLRERGLVRTDKEVQAIIDNAREFTNYFELRKNRYKIERLDGKGSEVWHKDKWIESNGSIADGKMLVYKNGVKVCADLVLIDKESFQEFAEERRIRLGRERREAVAAKTKKIFDKESIIVPITARRQKVSQKWNEFVSDYKHKTLTETTEELVDQGKVPVFVDVKTTVWVLRELCEKTADGTWRRKSETNKLRDTYENERPNERRKGQTEGTGQEEGGAEIEDFGADHREGEELGVECVGDDQNIDLIAGE